jgi:hypothetical protein
MCGVANEGARSRSQLSVRFEVRLRSLSLPNAVPSADALRWERLAEFEPNIALIELDIEGRKLPIRHAGAALSTLFAQNLPATDFQDLAMPNFRRALFDTFTVMAEQPCGAWQLVPVRISAGTALLECTAFPVLASDASNHQAIVFAVPLPTDGRAATEPAAPSIVRWLNLGCGVPAND